MTNTNSPAMVALAIKLRDEATAEGRHFKIRVNTIDGTELDCWLKENGYNLDGTRNTEGYLVGADGQPIDTDGVAYVTSGGAGSYSQRTVYTCVEGNLPSFGMFVFKDYDSKKADSHVTVDDEDTSEDEYQSDENDNEDIT